MECYFVLPDPGGQLLFKDLPDPVFALHPQHDPVAPVIAHIHGEQALRQTIRFAKIELSQSAIGLYQLGELYVPDELYLHKAPFEEKLMSDLSVEMIFDHLRLMSDLSVEMPFGHLVMNNSHATYQGGFLKNSEFFSQREREDVLA